MSVLLSVNKQLPSKYLLDTNLLLDKLKQPAPLLELPNTRTLLTYDRAVILVDAIDYERVADLTWHRTGCNKKAVVACVRGKFIYLGRFILQYDGPLRVYHNNKNALDNRRENLSVTKFKGTSKRVSGNGKTYWQTAYKVKGKWTYQGQYTTQEIAARVYDQWALRHLGPNTYLNFPLLQSSQAYPKTAN